MGFIVKCPICGKIKKIYRDKARFFVCCHTVHEIDKNLIAKTVNWKKQKHVEKSKQNFGEQSQKAEILEVLDESKQNFGDETEISKIFGDEKHE